RSVAGGQFDPDRRLFRLRELCLRDRYRRPRGSARLDGHCRFLGLEVEADRVDRRDLGNLAAAGLREDWRGSLDEADLKWRVIIHLTFVSSGVLLALMDLLRHAPISIRPAWTACTRAARKRPSAVWEGNDEAQQFG